MKTIMKITSVVAGSCFALTTAFTPALASTEGSAPSTAEQITSQQVGPQQVASNTSSVSENNYLIKYHVNEESKSVDVDLKVGPGNTLSTNDGGKTLQIIDSSGNVIETLDLPEDAGSQASSADFSSWDIAGNHEAKVSISAAALTASSKNSSGVSTQAVHAPSQAWYDCMIDRGIDGAIAGAVAGCAATAAVGCVEGALTGAGGGGIGNIVAGLWTCRGKY